MIKKGISNKKRLRWKSWPYWMRGTFVGGTILGVIIFIKAIFDTVSYFKNNWHYISTGHYMGPFGGPIFFLIFEAFGIFIGIGLGMLIGSAIGLLIDSIIKETKNK